MLVIAFSGNGVSLCHMNSAFGMLGRRINRIQFQRDVPCIDDVMPCSGRDKYGVVGRDAAEEIQIIFAGAHFHKPLTLLNP